jgi:hypothetical protein
MSVNRKLFGMGARPYFSADAILIRDVVEDLVARIVAGRDGTWD